MRLALLLLLVLPLTAAGAQRRGFGRMQELMGDENEYYRHPDFRGNVKYDGRFTFARIKYRGYGGFTNQGPGWSHDYPRAEAHLMRIMRTITSMRPFIESLDFDHPYYGVKAQFLGIFEDNDPSKRLLAIVNYNNDVSEYWEWSDQSFLPIPLSNEAYRLGVNYVVYGMTH